MVLSLVLILALALTVTFCCNLLEACTLSLSLTDIAKLSEKKPKIAAIWKQFKQNVEQPIAVILILNTLAHTIGALLGGAEFTKVFGPRWVGLFSLVFSFVIIEWTELLPKSLGVTYNRPVAAWAARPLQLIIPMVSPLLKFSEWLNQPFVGPRHAAVAMNAVDDISVLAEFAALNNLLSKDQADILARTMNLSKLQVKDVMVDKEEIKYLKTTMSLMDALIYAHIHHHTRLPLIQGDDVDQMIGYVNFKDIVSVLQINPQDPSLKGICRPIRSVYEDESLALILNKMTKSSQHIAVVRTRQEKVVGIVTQEDVMETIIGEVSDEYDVLPQHCYQITPSRYVAGGGVTLRELRGYTAVNVPDETTALSDWLKGQCGRIPKIEEAFVHEGSRFIVRKISRSNIHEVIIETGGKA